MGRLHMLTHSLRTYTHKPPAGENGPLPNPNKKAIGGWPKGKTHGLLLDYNPYATHDL